MKISLASVIVPALGLGGCAMPTSQATKDLQVAPEFTEADRKSAQAAMFQAKGRTLNPLE